MLSGSLTGRTLLYASQVGRTMLYASLEAEQ
jgi:hypothetical protein